MKLKLYFLTLLIFLGIDSFWLGLVAPKFYRSQIGHLIWGTVLTASTSALSVWAGRKLG